MVREKKVELDETITDSLRSALSEGVDPLIMSIRMRDEQISPEGLNEISQLQQAVVGLVNNWFEMRMRQVKNAPPVSRTELRSLSGETGEHMHHSNMR
jgi:hypothetical protein